MDVSYLLAEEAGGPGNAVNSRYTLLYTSVPCHGHISSAQMLTCLPTR